MIEKLVKNSSNENDLVFDPFLGSGTTAVARKKFNRNFIGTEINETYYKIALQRVAETTPEPIENVPPLADFFE